MRGQFHHLTGVPNKKYSRLQVGEVQLVVGALQLCIGVNLSSNAYHTSVLPHPQPLPLPRGYGVYTSV
ncbi:hypothetical protein NIES25_26360 [Nostoc linckia NIES-25]|nr:hypothetical protein NIES25_26360 [Nostoc linckia NIES-25]